MVKNDDTYCIISMKNKYLVNLAITSIITLIILSIFANYSSNVGQDVAILSNFVAQIFPQQQRRASDRQRGPWDH